MAVIDRTLVQRLIQTQLQTLQGAGVVDVVFPGEADPESSQRWTRLVAIDYAAVTGSKPNNPAVSDHAEMAGVTIALSVVCMPSLMSLSSGALTMAITHVCAAMESQTLRDVDSNHQLDLHRASIAVDATADAEQPGMQSAGITINAMVCRTAGSTLITV